MIGRANSGSVVNLWTWETPSRSAMDAFGFKRKNSAPSPQRSRVASESSVVFICPPSKCAFLPVSSVSLQPFEQLRPHGIMRLGESRGEVCFPLLEQIIGQVEFFIQLGIVVLVQKDVHHTLPIPVGHG